MGTSEFCGEARWTRHHVVWGGNGRGLSQRDGVRPVAGGRLPVLVWPVLHASASVLAPQVRGDVSAHSRDGHVHGGWFNDCERLGLSQSVHAEVCWGCAKYDGVVPADDGGVLLECLPY